MKNVTVYNAQNLSGITLLESGSKLLAEESDNVIFTDSPYEGEDDVVDLRSNTSARRPQNVSKVPGLFETADFKLSVNIRNFSLDILFLD